MTPKPFCCFNLIQILSPLVVGLTNGLIFHYVWNTLRLPFKFCVLTLLFKELVTVCIKYCTTVVSYVKIQPEPFPEDSSHTCKTMESGDPDMVAIKKFCINMKF